MSYEEENKKEEKINKGSFWKKLCSFAFLFLFISIICCGCNNIKPHTENISTIGKWSVVDGEMDKARFHTSAELLPDGNVLILGGYSDINSAQIYNPSTGKITNINPPVYNRSTFFATTKLQDGRISIQYHRNI